MRRMPRVIVPALLLVGLLLLLAAPAWAGTVLSNNVAGSGSYLVNFTSYATGFTVPAGGGNQRLTSVTINGAYNSSVVSRQVDVYLYSDNAGVPGSVITTLGSNSSPGGSFADFTATPFTPPTLTAGSSYWIVIGGFNYRLSYGDSAPAGAWTSLGTKANTPGPGWSDAPTPFYVRVNADPAPVTLNSITRNDPVYVDAASVSWTVTFSGPISSLPTYSFALLQSCGPLSGAFISGITGGGTTWTVTANTGSGNGCIGLNLVNVSGITPAVTNTLPFFGEQYNLVRNPPTTTISSTATATTNLSPIPVTVLFSYPMTGFTDSDVTVTNGTISNFTPLMSFYFSFDVTPAGQGPVTVDVPAGVAQDVAGHDNLAATQLTRTYDTLGPMPVISSLAPNPTHSAPIPVTVTFDDSVIGFTLASVVVGNGTPGNFSGGPGSSVFTFTVTPHGQGAVTVDVPAGVAVDTSGNGNTAATQFSRTYDSIGPMLRFGVQNSFPFTQPIVFTVTFSEPVTGFTASDIQLSSGSVANFAGSGSAYTFEISEAADGGVTVSVAAGAATDSVGNPNSAESANIPLDVTSPTVTFQLVSAPLTTFLPGLYTNGSPIGVKLSFSENVIGLTADDLIVTNAVVSEFMQVGSDEFGVALTPLAEGVVTLTLPAGAARDFFGNWNSEPAAPFMVTFVGPLTATITTGAANPTNASPIPVTVTFNRPVNGLTAAQVTVANGTAGNFSGGPGSSVFTFTVTPEADGLVTVNLAAGAVADVFGLINTAAAPLNLTYDGTPPMVTLTSTSVNPTQSAPIAVTATFSEPVTGFTETDVTVGNGTVSNFSGSGAVYTFDVNPVIEGSVSVDVAAGVAQDSAGNPNTVAVALYRLYDTSGPTVMLSSPAPNPFNAAFLTVTATFNEYVPDFTGTDITTNGTVSDFSGSGAVYTFRVTPTAQGPVTVSIAAGAVTDLAGNAGSASLTLSRTYDSVAPTVTITSSAPEPALTAPIPVTFTFSEPVSGFDSGELVLINGTLGNFSGSGAVYTADLTPDAPGPVSILLLPNTVLDAAGNPNLNADQFNRNYQPEIAVSSIIRAGTTPTNAASVSWNVTFAGSMSGLTAANFELAAAGVSGATLTDVSGNGANWTVTASTGTGDGTLGLSLSNETGLTPGLSTTLPFAGESYTLDRTAPTATITSSASNPTNVSPIPLTVTFSEPVTGFSASDMTSIPGSVSNVAGSGAVYTLDLVPGAQGSQYLLLMPGTVTDAAGNINMMSAEYRNTYDSASPTAVITSAASDPANGPFAVTITFNEDVTGFELSDVTVGNGAAGNFAGSGAVYTVDITPSASGLVTVDVAAGAATDSAGNGSTAAAQFSITYDGDAPGATISSSAPNPSSTSPIPISVAFSEAVTGFDVSDVAVGNGAAGNFAGSGTLYSFEVTPGGTGLVTVDVPAKAGNDSAGNGNSAAAQFSITFDADAPGVVISSTASNPTNTTPIPVTVTFSEAVTGFDASDVTIGNGTAGAISGGPAVYTFEVTPAAFGVVTVDVAAGAGIDSANNGSTAAAQFSVTYSSAALTAIELTVLNDGTDAATAIPNPNPAGTPSYTVISGGGTVDAVTGAFVHAFDAGAAVGDYVTLIEIASGAQVYQAQVVVHVLDATPATPAAPATPPPPPPEPLCEDQNFAEGGIVRSGAVQDGVAPQINCRVMYQNGSPTTWFGADLYGAGNLGIPGLMELGVQQAVDIFSPSGLSYFDGGAVFCLRGNGTLIWLDGNAAPKTAEIIGSYTVPEWAGFTCATLFEPGTLVLVSENPMQ